jgi:hypothetical protein
MLERRLDSGLAVLHAEVGPSVAGFVDHPGK